MGSAGKVMPRSNRKLRISFGGRSRDELIKTARPIGFGAGHQQLASFVEREPLSLGYGRFAIVKTRIDPLPSLLLRYGQRCVGIVLLILCLIQRKAVGIGLKPRSKISPMGMIFVPSRDGMSHSPKEFTSWTDVAKWCRSSLPDALVDGCAVQPQLRYTSITTRNLLGGREIRLAPFLLRSIWAHALGGPWLTYAGQPFPKVLEATAFQTRD